MNEISEIFKAAQDGESITLENKIYEIAPEDSFHLKGFFFSNTAKYEENPDGERFCAIYLDGKSDITIDGNGAKVMIHGKMTPFIFSQCRNIVMKNISFDHYRPTMSEFTVADDANFWFESGRSGNLTFENNTVINCAARYSAFGDDVIRYEPVVMDKTSETPVHKKLILRNNRFISGTGRNYFINLNYLREAVIEGNTSDVELKVINYRKA